MKRFNPLAQCLAAPAVLAAATAYAAIRHVATNGTDGAACGQSPATACRSITQAVSSAAAGDRILVAPGRYGDLDRSGVLGDSPGEEPAPIAPTVPLRLESTGGSDITVIDFDGVGVDTAFSISTNGTTIGRPRRGFTIVGVALIGNVWGYAQGGSAQKLTPMTGNNIFGNVSNCGTLNEVTSLDTLVATENYWGAASGPGPDPADDVCGFAPTTAVPYATKLLPVR